MAGFNRVRRAKRVDTAQAGTNPHRSIVWANGGAGGSVGRNATTAATSTAAAAKSNSG